ncbi:hypothetical protein MCEMSEM23_02450 [Rhabdaerophilaceae bacterium]
MSDLFGLMIEGLMSNRWWRYAICGSVIVVTLLTGEFSSSLPWIVLAVMVGWLVVHEFIDRHLKAKRMGQGDRHAPR